MSLLKKSLGVAATTLVTTGLSLVVAASPAAATQTECRTPRYVTSSWDLDICVSNSGLDDTTTFEVVSATATLDKRPSGCATFRVYLVDSRNVQRFSTSLRSCSESGRTVKVWDGEFGEGTVKARFVAFNSSGDPILSRESPYIVAFD